MTNPTDLIAVIRKGVAPDAQPESKQKAAQACRWLLTALEGEAGETLAPPRAGHDEPTTTPPRAQPYSPTQPLPTGQLLDVLIAKLKAALPDNEQAHVERPVMRIPFVPIPGARR